MEAVMLDRESAERFASWFKALADATRIQLVTLLATQNRAMTVGEIVAASGVGQSTVSHHLKALAAVRFVLSDADGTTRWYRINDACVRCFPSAADIVMGRQVPEPPPAAADEGTADVREMVRRRYSAAATHAGADRLDQESALSNIDKHGRAVFGAELYEPTLVAEVPPAAVGASLGCGVPTTVAALHPGETVLDLGCGAGTDALIAARRVGPEGRVFGLDMTQEMLALARRNAADAGVDNVEFLHGYLEDIPLPVQSIDVVISNCVVNLAADKTAVLREAARVLRPGGRLAVSDVIADADIDDATRADVAQQTGCIAGALTEADYRTALRQAGLVDVEISESHRVHTNAASAVIRARKP